MAEALPPAAVLAETQCRPRPAALLSWASPAVGVPADAPRRHRYSEPSSRHVRPRGE